MSKLKNLNNQKLLYAGILILPIPIFMLIGLIFDYFLHSKYKLSFQASVPYLLISAALWQLLLVMIGFWMARLLKANLLSVLVVNFILGLEMFSLMFIGWLNKIGVNEMFSASNRGKSFDMFFFSTLIQLFPILIGWGIGLYLNKKPKKAVKKKK